MTSGLPALSVLLSLFLLLDCGVGRQSSAFIRYHPRCGTGYYYCGGNQCFRTDGRCNLVPDCRNFYDELNCTRHPTAKPVIPFQIEGRWNEDGTGWSETNITVNRSESKVYTSPMNICKVSSVNRATLVGHIEDKRCVYYERNETQHRTFSYQNLLAKSGSNIVWTKNTAGKVPEGSVIFELSAQYELVFPCRVPTAFNDRVAKYNLSFGTMMPRNQGCELIGDAGIPVYLRYLRDYEILVSLPNPTDVSVKWNFSRAIFHCTDGSAILEDFVCDSENDCKDGEDENIDICRKRNGCSASQFPCSDGKCISMDSLCRDGEHLNKYCMDGSDESAETFQKYCSAEKFRCKGYKDYVIPVYKRCDGIFDCKDRSDEANCTKYRDLTLIKPSNTEDIWWFRGFWLDVRKSNIILRAKMDGIVSYNLQPYLLKRSAIPKNGSYSFGLYRNDISREGLLLGRKLDFTYFNSQGWIKGETFLQFQVLQNEDSLGNYTWVKSTKGRIPDGAVTWGLTPSFQFVFVCKANPWQTRSEVPQAKVLVGQLIPSEGKCFVPDFPQNDFWDYEILRDTRYYAETYCDNSTFKCRDPDKCIPSHLVCDGNRDCEDGQDEDLHFCQKNKHCVGDTFPCPEGRCIPMSLTCRSRDRDKNNKFHCLDGSDELPSACGANVCGYNEFQCGDGQCIVPGKVCDLKIHCADGSDENNCDQRICGRDQYKCGNSICIDQGRRCDRSFECSDGSDEKHCGEQICRVNKYGLSYVTCRNDSYDLESLTWRKGLWLKRGRLAKNQTFISGQDRDGRPRFVCRVLEFNAGSSRVYVGLYGYDGEERYSCTDWLHLVGKEDEGLLSKVKVELLSDETPSILEWVKHYADNPLPNGAVIAGMTEEYEIILICRPHVSRIIHASMYPVTAYMARRGECEKGRHNSWTFSILVDKRYEIEENEE